MRPMRRAAAALLFAILIAASARADNVVERLSVPGPISLHGQTYTLAWSSHPTPDYYKQEYLPAGQTLEHYRSMVMIDAIVQGVDVQRVVTAKIAWLNQRKATDPTVNFALFKSQKSDEMILDFVLSATDPTGEDIVEWNAYRYVPLKAAGGKSGVLLVALSRRAYGEATTEFLRALKSARMPMIDAVAKYPLPAVRVAE